MAATRHFLGWDQPVLRKIVAFLLPTDTHGPVDLSADLIVVPTRQAGRRLRQALAMECAKQDSALLSVRVVTPSVFLHGQAADVRVATESVVRAVWVKLLMDCDLTRYPALFPVSVAHQDFDWAVHMADLLQGLRGLLVEGGHDIKDVSNVLDEACPEPERWKDLASLEVQYLEQLDKLDLADPLAQRIKQSETVRLPEEVRRIVVAAVPDPTHLVIRAWQQLSQSCTTVVLVHAPPNLANSFDSWGRPNQAAWQDHCIEVPDPERNLVAATTPSSQARRAIELIAQEAERFSPQDVAVGAPDANVIPSLVDTFSQQGLETYDPAGRPARTHSLFHLLKGYRDLIADRSFDALRGLLRHPDLLECLWQQHQVATSVVLTQVDLFQNKYLPTSLEDVLNRMGQLGPESRRAYSALETSVGWLQKYVQGFFNQGPQCAVRQLLKEIYSGQTLDSMVGDGESLIAVSELVNQALGQIGDSVFESLGTDPLQLLDLILKQLANQIFYTESQDSAIPLEGWLELPWSEAPLLIVTGMNDGVVPDSRIGDQFLPDSLRRRLRLRSEADRFARDAYLMQSLIASRQGHGRACFIFGRTSAEGDPLKPSRLLFQCSDDALPERVKHLFGTVAEAQNSVAFQVSFKLHVQPPSDVPETSITPNGLSVTDFRNYLTCPFRYYLSQVLGMKPLDDRKTALDALDFGSLVHHSLQILGQSKSLRSSMDESTLTDAVCGEAQRWVDRQFGLSPPLPVVIQLEAAKQRLKAAVRVHVASRREGWEMIDAEHAVQGTIGGMSVRGRIDRIDRHCESGAIRVLDYKTSDEAKLPAAAHLGTVRPHVGDYAIVTVKSRAKAWCDLQLPLYQLLLEQEGFTELPIRVGYFSLPKAVSETGVNVWAELQDDLIESAALCAQGVVNDVRARRFWPPSEHTPYDEFQSLFCSNPEDCFDVTGFRQFTEQGG